MNPRLSHAPIRPLFQTSILLLLCLGGLAPGARATIYVNEPFNYVTGNLGGQGGWTGGQSIVQVTSGSLDGTALGLIPSTGNKVTLASTTAGNTITNFVGFGTLVSGVFYFSFLLQVNDPTSVSATGESPFFFNVQNSGSTRAIPLYLINVGGNIEIGVAKGSSTSPKYVTSGTGSAIQGSTVLVVGKYTFITGANNDEIRLWVNPASVGGPEDPSPAILIDASDNLGDVTSSSGIGRFYFVAGVAADVDELRMGTDWAEVTPSPLICDSAFVFADPGNATVTEGLSASFAVGAGGSAPNYQWQRSADGSTWSNVTGGRGANTAAYSTPNLTVANDGNQYRCLISVLCNGSSATSGVAVVTVNAAVRTPPGLVVNDDWSDLSRLNLPFDTNNSTWYASTASTLSEPTAANAMTGTPSAGSSRLWVGYFTDGNVNLPVHLDIGNQLKATLVFSADNIVTNDGNLRFGLFDYADGGTRLSNDGFGTGSTGNGAGVRGYMLTVAFGTNWSSASPLGLNVRSDTTGNGVLSAGYSSLGSGPGGLLGAPAFQNGTNYTLEFSVTRTAQTSASITARFSGGGSTWTHTATDNGFAYPRFDAFGIRPNSQETTADSFTFKQFRPRCRARRIGRATTTPWRNSTSKAPSASLPPLPFRLLPGGANQFPGGSCTR